MHAVADALENIAVGMKTAQRALDQRGRLPSVVHVHVGHAVRHDRVLALAGQEDHHLVGAASAQKNAMIGMVFATSHETVVLANTRSARQMM